MKVGLDGFALHPLKLDPFGMFDYCAANGFEGVLLSGVRNLSKSLDHDELMAVRSYGDERGLYTHVSVYPTNPHLSESSRDEVVADLTAQIEAAAACGWHELHSSLGAEKDRYESDVPWDTQIADATDVLKRVAPVLREHGSRINLENHGDTTTWELVRLTEEVGPDAVGICLDTANLLVFAENPVDAATRAAPYVHLTHVKDAIVFFCETGLQRQGRPPGQGCIAWEQVLTILGQHSPDLHLSIEDHKWFFFAHIFDDKWMAEQKDLSRDELVRTVQLAWNVQQRINAGELPDPDEYEAIPYADEMQQRLEFGRDYLNNLLERLGLQE
jgi:sugar phosphate isomerase/epimerase